MENNQNQAPQSSKGIGIGALVCGILGLVGGPIPVVCYFTLVLSIVAIVLGAKGKKQALALGEPTGMATAGLVLGIIGVAIAAAGVLCAIAGCIGLAAVLGAAGA